MSTPDPRLSNDQQLQFATTHVVSEGAGAGTRVLLVHPAGGLHCRVLLDRGMDIGAAWYAGQPVAWTSPSGERRPGYGDLGENWHRGWAGGLLTTCGLRHIGPPGGGFGRHGRFSDCPTEDLVVRRTEVGGRSAIEAQGTVRETDGVDRGVVLRRTLRWFVGEAALEVDDEVVNETGDDLAVPILYHLNLGYPFLTADSVTSSTGLDSPTDFPTAMGDPAAVEDEVVLHRAASAGGTAEVTVTSPELGARVRVGWATGELNRAYTWRRRVPGAYVQGVEPANAALVETTDDPWPVLAPGGTRSTGFTLTVEPDGAGSGTGR